MTQMTKSEYIAKSLEEYAVFKIETSSNGLLIVVSYFLFLSIICFDSPFSLCTLMGILTIICIFLRKFFCYLYKKNNRPQFYIHLINIFITLTAIFWAMAIHLILFSPLTSTTTLMTVFFTVGTMVTFAPTNLAYNRGILIVFISILMIPVLYYCYYNYVQNELYYMNWILVFVLLFIWHFYLHAAAIRNQLIQSLNDNYELKKSYVELEKKSQLLEEETLKTFHVTRLSSLGEMAGSIAHEINNPLMVITGSINLLKKNKTLSEDNDLKRKFDKIKKASSRIADIVKSMKMVASKHDDVEMESVNLNQLIEQVLVLYEDKFKIEGVELRLHSIPHLNVKANPVQVSQILLNLISNAFDEVIKVSPRVIEIEVLDNQYNVNILVKNTGNPIPESVQQKMFEPFYTTKPLNKGTGLGLSISRSLAKENNGFLEYSPIEDMICFRLNLNKA